MISSKICQGPDYNIHEECRKKLFPPFALYFIKRVNITLVIPKISLKFQFKRGDNLNWDLMEIYKFYIFFSFF